jgi:hypothetical protein
MYTGLWDFIFLPIWEQQSNILHTPESIVTIAEHRQFDVELIDRKRDKNQRLHHTQRHLTEYTTEELKTWTVQHKKTRSSYFRNHLKTTAST